MNNKHTQLTKINNDLSCAKRILPHKDYLDKLYSVLGDEVIKKEIKDNKAIIKDIAENITTDDINNMYDLMSDSYNPVVSKSEFVSYVKTIIK